MHHITFISTTHKENGYCNANELCNIIEQLAPEVIFLEALQETYSKYDEYLFSQYSIFHKKLKIEAIQKYQYRFDFKYVPVLDVGLSDSFDKKYEIVTQNIELQRKLGNFNVLASECGFQFLNSDISVELQEDMRKLENKILRDSRLNKSAIDAIDTYENSMLENIYFYCKTNEFRKAIFMCGAAHRRSIAEKIKESNKNVEIKVDWRILNFSE